MRFDGCLMKKKKIRNLISEGTREGLFIDLTKTIKYKGKLRVPITAIGHYTDMDKVYDL